MQAMRRVLGIQSSSDFHDHGLQLLVPDPTDAQELQVKRTVDVVFIHGLTGTWDGTWTGETPDGRKVLWPKELLKERFSTARISSFSYDANAVNLVHRVSTQSITQHANDLLIELETLRRETRTQEYKLVFVVHSLGGLVVQKMLALSKNSHEAHYQRIESLTVGAAFFGTPMLGADIAAWASIGTALSSILKQTNRDIVGILEPNSSMAESIRLDITNLVAIRAHTANPIKIACFYECLPVPGYGKVVVNDKSATWPPHYQKGIQADHMNMTKFASTQARGYRDFIGEVGRWIDEDTGETRQPSEILSHLDFYERTARQQQIENADALESTLDWIWSKKHQSRSSFAQWLLNDQVVFWIQGKPGSGKSTLMSYLEKASGSWQKHSRSDSHWSTIRFFFDFRAHSGLANNLEGFLRSLLLQILKQNPSSEDEIHRLEEKFGDYKPGKWASSALKEALFNTLRQILVNICILVDGLDEFSGNVRELMTLFHKIPSRTNTGHLVKICLASRPHPVIAMALEDWPGLQMQAHNEKAIKQYAFTTMGILGVTANDRWQFSAEIARKAEGVFLWARFAVKEIINGYAEGEDANELYQRLEELPSDLEQLYARIFKGMNSRDREEAQIMFQLVCFVQGMFHQDLMNLRQLKEAVALCQNDTSEIDQCDSVEELERFRRRLKAKSGGLLEELSVGTGFSTESGEYYLDLESGDDSEEIGLEPIDETDKMSLKSGDETLDLYTESEVAHSKMPVQLAQASGERAQEHFKNYGGKIKLIHRTAESYLKREGWFLEIRTLQVTSPHALWLQVCCKSIKSKFQLHESQLRHAEPPEPEEFQRVWYNLFHYAIDNLFVHARSLEFQDRKSSLPFLEIVPPTLWRYLRRNYRLVDNWEWPGNGSKLWDWGAVDTRSDRQPRQIIVEQGLPLSLKDAVLRKFYTVPRDGEDISLALVSGRVFRHVDDGAWPQLLLSYLIQFGAVVRERHIIECLYTGRASWLETLLASWPKETIRLRRHPLSSMSPLEQANEDCMYNGQSVGVLYELVRVNCDNCYSVDFEAKLLLLLERGEVLNEIGGPGGTALHASIINVYLSEEWVDTEEVRMILSQGADPNIIGPRGTPLQLAWRMFRSLYVDRLEKSLKPSHQKAMRLLLDYGANTSWVEPNGVFVNPHIIEDWCAMSNEEVIARWGDDDYPYCKSNWVTYEFPLYHRRNQPKIDASNDTSSPPRKRRR